MVDSRSLATSYMPKNQSIGYRQEVKRLINGTPPNSASQQKIIFIGSSIFRLWKTLASDMSPLPIINQAFGGSRTWEVLYYSDQLIIPYQPKIIVYYCGSNDLHAGLDAQGITHRFQIFFTYLQSHLPKTKVFFVSINKSPQKQEKWHIIDAVNDAISQYAQANPNLEFIDLNPDLFDQAQQPRLELFTGDSLHLKPLAYQKFTAIIKPILKYAWNKLS